MADLPDISPDLDQPLPQVDPNSQLVPYRTSSTQPGELPVVTTGWGPRARPIQPPSGGGVGVPDMSAFLGESMQHLPVDEALRATAAASQYIAQRGYQRDIANGESAPKALMKWLPVMRNSTGLSEALQFQQAQLKAAQPTIRAVGGRLYRVPPTVGEAVPISPEPPPKVVPPKIHFNNTTGEAFRENADGTLTKIPAGTPKPEKKSTITIPLDPANPDGAKISGPSDDPDVQAAVAKHEEFFKQKPPPPPPPNLAQRVQSALGIGGTPSLSAPAVSPQEFVPDTSKAAPTPADLPNLARKKQPTQGAVQATPSSKVTKAKELAKKHPDWTKKQIIDAVNSGVE